MRTERCANLAMADTAERDLRGVLGERRAPHPRPSLLKRFLRRWLG